MQFRIVVTIIFTFLCSTYFLFGQEGGPQMLTDDAQVADFKEWEINTSFNTSIYRTISTLSVPHIDLNYGLLPWLQLKIEAPLLVTIPKGGKSTVSVGEIIGGVKMKFLKEEEHFISAATFPQYYIDPNTKDQGVLLPIFIEKRAHSSESFPNFDNNLLYPLVFNGCFCKPENKSPLFIIKSVV